MTITTPFAQVPGVYHRKVGDIVVSSVSDGFLNGDLNVLLNIESDKAHAMMRAARRPARRTSVNCFVVFTAGRIALIDTGCGPYMGKTAGLLLDNLQTLGISPEAIDSVLLTHLHPDHAGGLSIVETGTKRFPNAEVVLHKAEMKHWHDASAQAGARGMQTMFFGPAQNHIEPYKDALRLIEGGEVLPGIHAMECPGHTPGHLAYVVESGNEQLVIWGDTIHVQEIQIPLPDVGVKFDSDVALAAQSRRRLFDQIATDELLAAGMHVHFPGHTRLSAEGDGFQFYQEAWVHNLRGTEI